MNDREILWMSLADERPFREYHWLSSMPRTQVTVAGGPPPSAGVKWIERGYHRPVTRFTEAVALAWMRDTKTLPGGFDWVASLELCSLISAQAQQYSKRTQTKHCVTIWANDPELMFYRVPPYSLATKQTRSADMFLNFIRAGYDHCLALGLEPERCAYVRPGVDTDTFFPAISRQSEPVISFASGLVPKKGLRSILTAFELVRRSLPEARLLVMGTGPDRTLVTEAQRRTRGAVEYRGSGGPEAVSAMLREAAVFTTAPVAQRRWNEQYGMAYLEAMACGLPIVTTITGTNNEAVAPPNLRVPHDPEALAEALLKFLCDPERGDAVGATNRARAVRDHNVITQSERMADVFGFFERHGRTPPPD